MSDPYCFFNSPHNNNYIDGDYTEPVPNSGTLNRAVPIICSEMNTVSDDTVEGSESFNIQFVFVETSGTFTVDVNDAEITILDDDCKNQLRVMIYIPC